MHPSIVTDFAIVLGVAAVTGTLFRLLRQPPVLGYLVAGLIVGPYIPIPLFADTARVHELSEFGVVLVMFAVGLEFSLARVAKVVPLAGVVALVQIGGMFWAGHTVGALLGLSTVSAVFLGASVAISSTMVVTKVFDLHAPPPEVRALVLGVLVLQDLVAIVLIAIVTGVAHGTGLAPAALLSTLGRLLGVLAAVVLVGIWIVPRVARRVWAIDSDEVSTVFALGLCFSAAVGMQLLGYSPALGAFLAGMLVAESGLGERFEHLVAPLRDAFAAVFFVSVGMTVDPRLAIEHLPASLLVAGTVVALQGALVTSAGLLSGLGLRRAGHAGLALGQIGEFGFIIMGIGTAAGVVPEYMFTVIVAASVVTAFTTPVALRSAPALLTGVDRRLPKRLRMNLSLYAAWLDELRRSKEQTPRRRKIRHALRVIVLDAIVVITLVVLGSLGLERAAAWIGARVELAPQLAKAVVVIAVGGVVFPFAWGLMRAARNLGSVLAESVFPGAPQGRVDLTTTSRRAMSVGLQVVALLAAGLLVTAVTQPFVPVGVGLPVLAAALLPSVLLLRRSGGPLGEHVHSATLALIDFLRRDEHTPREPQLKDLLHGLGSATTVRIDAGAPAIARSLADLNLRARTGAVVLAIAHVDSDVAAPTGHEILREGDVLAVAGPHEAVARARAVLLGERAPEPTGTDAGASE